MLGLCGWLVYVRVYGHGGDRPLEWVDRTSALGTPAFRRRATGAFESRAELAAFLDDVVRGRRPRLPEIDFSHRRALLVTTGPRSSTGYALAVLSIREERRRLVVRVRERTPGLRDRVAARVTYPFRLVTIPRSQKPVTFTWEGR